MIVSFCVVLFLFDALFYKVREHGEIVFKVVYPCPCLGIDVHENMVLNELKYCKRSLSDFFIMICKQVAKIYDIGEEAAILHVVGNTV